MSDNKARFRPPPSLVCAAIEIALNRLFTRNLDAAEWRPLAGRVLAIEFEQVGWVITIAFRHAGLHLLSAEGIEADTVLRGTPAALARLAGGSLAAGEVEIRGDVALARQFESVMRGNEFDWEGLLAERTGDLAAYRIGRAVAAARGQGREGLDALQRNLQLGLLDWGVVATAEEVEQFIDETDRLRDGVERLHARIERLLLRGAGTA